MSRYAIAVFDPDVWAAVEAWAAVHPTVVRVESLAEPVGRIPLNDDSRRAVAAYRELVDAYGQDTRGLPGPGAGLLFTVVCAGSRAHVLARVFRSGRRRLFVGAVDWSRRNYRHAATGEVLRTFAHVKVAARFLDARGDDARYPVKCYCRDTVWLSRDKLEDMARKLEDLSRANSQRKVPASAVLMD